MIGFLRALHLIGAQAAGQLVNLFFGIADQRLGDVDRDLWVGGDHIHLDQAFGRVVGDFHIAAIGFVGGSVRGIRRQPLQRVDGGIRIMRAKAVIGIKPGHRVLRLEIALHRNRILRRAHRRAFQQAAKRAGGGIGALDDEFGVGFIKRRGDGVVINPGHEGGQHHEDKQPRHQQQRFLAAAGGDIALDAGHFGDMGLFGTLFGRGQLRGFDGLRQLDAITAGGDGQRARAGRLVGRAACGRDQLQHRIGLKRINPGVAQQADGIEI
ncbi:MAG: hypothetical protein ACD_54C00434G0002 [uncultured bacterium]|nr:MAG: hypothetical protein ACD_54C00434G0002 [uncultured bacterium]